MSNDTRQSEEVILGKKFPGEKFATVRSAETVAAEQLLEASHAHENAIPLTVYFSIRGHHDPVLQRMLFEFTSIRTATKDAFDTIFAKFFGVPAEPSNSKKEV